MKFFTRFSVLLVLLSASALVSAEGTGYEVELIIFEDAKSRYLNSEKWSYNDMLNNVKDLSAATKPDKDSQFKELDWNSAKLAANLKRIKSNPNYNVLINKRWKQTGLDRENSFNFNISSKQQTASNESEVSPAETVSSYIAGDVKLIMSRYLHFAVNLQYFRPYQDENFNQLYQSFPVVSERRMKSREIHYIDHPLVGIIILATPYKFDLDGSQSSLNTQ